MCCRTPVQAVYEYIRAGAGLPEAEKGAWQLLYVSWIPLHEVAFHHAYLPAELQ